MNRFRSTVICSSLSSMLLACSGGGGSNSPDPSPTLTPTPTPSCDTDFSLCTADANGNGLIEVDSLEKLDWIRYSLDGSALVNDQGESSVLGCPESGCKGYELTQDIDFGPIPTDDENNPGWLPIGKDPDNPTEPQAFTGIFDGNGFSIENLYINRHENTDDQYIGLFSILDGSQFNEPQIRNLFLDSVNIEGYAFVGALAGMAEDTDIFNLATTGFITGEYYHTGGLLGSADRVSLNSVTVIARVEGFNTNTGGLIGSSSDITLERVVSTGRIDAGNNAGGLIGRASQHTTIENTLFTGLISALNSTGGFLGYSDSVSIENSFMTGTISSDPPLGGFVGSINDVDTASNIENSFAAVGYILEDQEAGGWITASWEHYTPGNMMSVYYATDINSDNFPSPIGNEETPVTDDEALGTELDALQCATNTTSDFPDTSACENDIFVGWNRSYWNFGNSSELPGLTIDGVLFRDGDANGILDLFEDE